MSGRFRVIILLISLTTPFGCDLIIKYDKLSDSLGWSVYPPHLQHIADGQQTVDGADDIRVIYLKGTPEELYLVRYDPYYVEVKAIYNEKLSKYDWIDH
jgi:hypothetical protein